MRTESVKIYSYDELNETAKAKARDWYRGTGAIDPGESARYITDEFITVAKACGWNVSFNKYGPAIYWDTNPIDAAFQGAWNAARVDITQLQSDIPGAASKENAEINRIAKGFKTLSLAYPTMFANAEAPRGTHGSMHITSDIDEGELDSEIGEQFDTLTKDLCHWLANQINNAIEYENEDETVAENIRCNEYEFTEDGSHYA
jgi:hypothetical protein